MNEEQFEEIKYALENLSTQINNLTELVKQTNKSNIEMLEAVKTELSCVTNHLGL